MLNEAQHYAVVSNAKNILCLAGAGTGKTHSMLARIDRLIEDGISPENMLVLTFTNAAAREMTDRFNEKHRDLAISPKFCTFHAFCMSLIVKDMAIRNTIGYSKVPMVCSDFKYREIEQHAIQITGISPVRNPTSRKDKKDQEILDKYVRKSLIAKNYITFDIMCKDVCQLFIDNCPAAIPYKEQFSHIFIDEFQDTDPLQWKFAKSLKYFDEDINIFIVGDALQAIYGFRGADDSIIKSLAIDPEWEVIKLSTNYRSDMLIIKSANIFSDSYADKSYKITMQPREDADVGSVMDKKFHIVEEQNELVLKCLEKLPQTSTAILARTNKEIYFIEEFLKSKGIKYRNSHNTANIIGQNLIKCLLDDNYTIDYLSSFLYTEEYNEFLRQKYSDEHDNKKLLEFIGRYMKSEQGKRYIGLYYKLSKHMSDDISKITNILRYDLCVSASISNCTDIDDVLIKLQDLERSDSDIYVGTIHSVKGLEYDNIIVTGVNTKSFMLDNDDNRNLYYVAITRAKHNLCILRKE